MRPVRNLLLLATTALVLMATFTTAASAQTVELLEEGPGGNVHCPPIEPVGAHSATGGCVVHFVGSFVMMVHSTLGEVLFTDCVSEFSARFDEDGQGYLFDQLLLGPQCGLEACDEPEPSHASLLWPALMYEGPTESGASTEGMVFTFCFSPSNQPEGGIIQMRCTVPIDVFQTGHAQQLVASPFGDGEDCLEVAGLAVVGEWGTEAPDPAQDEIEIDHDI